MILAMLAAAAFTCGAATRPGLAELGEDGVWRGTLVEQCRARAAGQPIAFHGYDEPTGLRAAAADRIAFLSPDEAAAVRRTGPVVATERQLLVVRARSPLRTGDAVQGLVCFIIGTRAEDALDAWAGSATVERLPFQEPDEMADAFAVGKCAAAAVDAAELPDRARVVATLAETPILATTLRSR